MRLFKAKLFLITVLMLVILLMSMGWYFHVTASYSCTSRFSLKFHEQGTNISHLSKGEIFFTFHPDNSGTGVYAGAIITHRPGLPQTIQYVNRTIEFNYFRKNNSIVSETLHVAINANDTANSKDVVQYVHSIFEPGKKIYSTILKLGGDTYAGGEGRYPKALCQPETQNDYILAKILGP